MIESFYTLIKKSYDFNKNIFDTNPQWTLIKELFERNFVHNEDHKPKLPKKIHQIWLGSPLPAKYIEYADTWKRFNPEWEYKLWTDRDVHDVDIPRIEVFNSIKNMGQKSDFLRYHILNEFGGLYIDTDFECLKSFDSLSYAEFLVGVGYPAAPELYIGLIGSVPGHPIISNVVAAMDKIKSNGWREIFNTTGTYFFTRIFFEVITEYTKGVVVLPTDYFYPFSNKIRHMKNGKDFIKECSYAIHYWDVAWN